MEKERFEKAEIEIIEFDSEDVITTSGGVSEGDIDVPFGNQ